MFSSVLKKTEIHCCKIFLWIVFLCPISRPDLIDMEVVSQQSNRENLEQAFEIAESLGVTRLLDAEGERKLFFFCKGKNIPLLKSSG